MINAETYREIIIEAARGKYIETGVTKNITEALKMYMENDAAPDEQIPIFITSPEIGQIRTILEKIRPQCDECDEHLFLQQNPRDRSGNVYPTGWVCENCGMEYYSDKTLTQWLEELRIEDRKRKLRNADESVSGDVPIMRPEPEI